MRRAHQLPHRLGRVAGAAFTAHTEFVHRLAELAAGFSWEQEFVP
ncbi:MAG: hypothetical protein ACREOQ_07695 [Gemmatimonadales bacterium]